MRWFHSFDTMDWGRVSLLVAGATVFWVTMGAVVPEPYYKWVSTFLLAISNTVALMMRSGKSRDEKIEDKRAEIKELTTSEVAESKAKKEEKK